MGFFSSASWRRCESWVEVEEEEEAVVVVVVVVIIIIELVAGAR